MLISEEIGKLFYFEICRVVIGLLVLTSSATSALHSLETPIREAVLKPRSYNPHPFEQSYHNYHGTSHTTINLNGIESDYVSHSVYDIDVPKSLPARHPSNGRYSQAPHQFPPTLPPGQNPRNLNAAPYVNLNYNRYYNGIDDDDNNSFTKKQYAFSYTVRDMHSGDDFSHTQQQKNGAVKGTYKVQLPDGRTQVVRYTADNDGYRADVSYLIDKNSVGFQDGTGHNLISKSDQQHVNVQSYNSIYDENLVQSPLHPIAAPSSPIFVSTVKPPIDVHSGVLPEPHFNSKLSFEDRKSISAKPTYVVSPKLTHVNDAIRILPNVGSVDDNPAAFHETPGLYFKQQYHQHHPVFYKSH